jgi:uncharacterized membrane protein
VGPGSLPYVDRVLEYPVGAGLLLYTAALLAPGPLGVLVLTGAASAVLCVTITVLLERRVGDRAWRWALGAPLALYAFQNWDVFAVAAMLAGLLAYERGAFRRSGVMLGLGAAVKLFPGVLLVPLVAVRLARHDRRGARDLAAWGLGSFAVLNVPILLASPSGWWWSYAFQGRRQATWGTAWFSAFRLLALPVQGSAGAHLANTASLVALVGGIGWLTVRAHHARLDPAAVVVAGVAIVLLTTKVYSPTYDLWLLAGFALLPFSRRLWFTFCGVDLAIFVTVYGSFHGFRSALDPSAVLPLLVAARTALLLFVIRDAARSHAPSTERTEPVVRAAAA